MKSDPQQHDQNRHKLEPDPKAKSIKDLDKSVKELLGVPKEERDHPGHSDG